MNKTLTSWLSVVVVFLCLPSLVCFGFSGGDGSYENPYEISNKFDIDDLAQMSRTNDCSGVYFLQTADVDVSVWTYPIGTSEFPFKGNYDGGGCCLSNIIVEAAADNYFATNAFAFFGYVQNAIIANVATYGRVNVFYSGADDTVVGVGGVCGVARNSIFENCKNYASVSLSAFVPYASSQTRDLHYGAAGICGVFRAAVSGARPYFRFNENYGDIKLFGGNGRSGVAGVFNFGASGGGAWEQHVESCNNFGRILACDYDNVNETGNPFVCGVFSQHSVYAGGSNRNPNAYSCANFGTITTTGAYHSAGIQTSSGYFSSEWTLSQDCTNYGDINATVTANADRIFVAGIMAEDGVYSESRALRCVNLGTISVSEATAGRVHAAGIFVTQGGYANQHASSGNKNFGAINVRTEGQATVGGIGAYENQYWLYDCENYGTIVVDAPKVYVGGIAAEDHIAANYRHYLYLRNCLSAGKIICSERATAGAVGGLISGDDVLRTATAYNIHVTISNSYSLATYSGDKNIYGGLIGVADPPAYAPINIYNCYCLLADGEAMVGYADTSLNSLVISNCTAIAKGNASFVGTLNGDLVTYQASIVNYSDLYHAPSVPNLVSIYTSAYKATPFFDLILPINSVLFPTITDEVKDLHNWTKAQGYKRYIRTIQQ